MRALGGAAGDLGGGLGCWGDVADEDGMAAAGGGSADDDGGEGSSCLESDNWRSRPISVLTFCLPLPALAVPGEWRGPTRECASPQAASRDQERNQRRCLPRVRAGDGLAISALARARFWGLVQPGSELISASAGLMVAAQLLVPPPSEEWGLPWRARGGGPRRRGRMGLASRRSFTAGDARGLLMPRGVPSGAGEEGSVGRGGRGRVDGIWGVMMSGPGLGLWAWSAGRRGLEAGERSCRLALDRGRGGSGRAPSRGCLLPPANHPLFGPMPERPRCHLAILSSFSPHP